ncbi:MAG TPA: ATP-binding cassette domain-containing protein, partial [Methanomassiliicoccales archaeon]|nr:ATP-binding cassette domain-containing protein [Methanomassiliicoccales archaeon]
MNAVEVKGLVKSYGRFQAVRGISFDVREGEVYGLIGPNGAGKTTTLRVLSTLLEITSGSVMVHGIDLKERPDE